MPWHKVLSSLALSFILTLILPLAVSTPARAADDTRNTDLAFYHDKGQSSGSPFGDIKKSIEKGKEQKKQEPKTPQAPQPVPQAPLAPPTPQIPFTPQMPSSQQPQVPVQLPPHPSSPQMLKNLLANYGPDDPGIDIDSLIKRLLACGDNTGSWTKQTASCWGKVMEKANKEIMTQCGMNSTCMGVGFSDVGIAEAIARMDYDAKKAKTLKISKSGKTEKIPQANPKRAAALLTDWEKKLDKYIPLDIRNEIEKYTSAYPIEGEARPHPIVFILTDKGGKFSIEPRPARKDWAYALLGGIFTQAGLSFQKYARFLDLGLWCFIKAAQTRRDEAEHLSNIGFFSNLLRTYDNARDILARARELNPNHPDVRGNLAFSLRRLGHDKAADSELEAAISLDLSDKVAEVTDILDKAARKGLSPPPEDHGLVYHQLYRQYALSYSKLEKRYKMAKEIPLETGEDRSNPDKYPRAVYEKRSEANRNALSQCLDAIPKIPPLCPMGKYVYTPHVSQNCVDSRTQEAKRRQAEKQKCLCNLRYLERDLQNYKIFVNEHIRLVKRFDQEWTPSLEKMVRYWKYKIVELNAIYSAMKSGANEDGTQFVANWDQFNNMLTEHYDDLKRYETKEIPSFQKKINRKISSTKSTQRKCKAAARAEAEYIKEAFSGPIKCAPVMGNTYTFKVPFINAQYFISTGRIDKSALKIVASIPGGVSGEYWAISKWGEVKAEGGGVTVGKSIGPVGGKVWVKSSGDWGAKGSFDLIGVVNPTGKIPGPGSKIVKKLLKFSSKYEAKFDNKQGLSGGEVSPPSLSPTIGYKKHSGVPPAWVRLHSKARKSDRWPIITTGRPPPPGGSPLPDYCP
jgi:tetratricopeptide (TPR) repeat protein